MGFYNFSPSCSCCDYSWLFQSKREEKGDGWQFIRYTVLSVSIPIVAILALNNALTGEAATLIAGAMGYAFGKNDKDRKKNSD